MNVLKIKDFGGRNTITLSWLRTSCPHFVNKGMFCTKYVGHGGNTSKCNSNLKHKCHKGIQIRIDEKNIDKKISSRKKDLLYKQKKIKDIDDGLFELLMTHQAYPSRHYQTPDFSTTINSTHLSWSRKNKTPQRNSDVLAFWFDRTQYLCDQTQTEHKYYKLRGENLSINDLKALPIYNKPAKEKILTQQVTVLVGTRGCGKTTLLKQSLLDIEHTYIQYFIGRKLVLPKILCDYIVLDDIHYMRDDVKCGKLTENEIMSVLTTLSKEMKDGKKIILVSEDALCYDYFQSDIWRDNLYKVFGVQTTGTIEIYWATAQILEANFYIDISNIKYKAFLNHWRVTPRSLIKFINTTGATYYDMVRYLKEIACEMTEREITERFVEKTAYEMLELREITIGCWKCGDDVKISEYLFITHSADGLNKRNGFVCALCGGEIVMPNVDELAQDVFSSDLLNDQSYKQEIIKAARVNAEAF